MNPKILFDSINDTSGIQRLIDERIPESEQLDYKEAVDKFSGNNKEDVAKIACAMANSGGGIVIYGVDTDKSTVPEKPIEITGILSTNCQSIETVINTRVTSNIVGWEAKSIKENDTLKAFLVCIPDSEFVPHQSMYDNLFYGRKGSSSNPLDCHAVLQLFNKRKSNLETSPIISLRYSGGQGGEHPQSVELILQNIGLSPAINIRVSFNNKKDIISCSCLAVNDSVKMSGILQGVKKYNASQYIVEYKDIMNADYRVVVPAGRGGLWWQCKPEMCLFKENKQLI